MAKLHIYIYTYYNIGAYTQKGVNIFAREKNTSPSNSLEYPFMNHI